MKNSMVMSKKKKSRPKNIQARQKLLLCLLRPAHSSTKQGEQEST
ncbi:hypothetical protein [Lelliottia nimipressuralis]